MCRGPCGASRWLTARPPTPEPGQQDCGAEESRCRQGSCLAQHRFCDGTDDCGDGSDEDAAQCSETPGPGRASCPEGGTAGRGVTPAQGWYQPNSLQGPPRQGEGWDPHPWVTRLSLPAESFTLCSFEQNLCGWEVEAGQPAWQRNTSLSLGTAYGVPGRDHSTNSRAGAGLAPAAGGAHHGSPGRRCTWGGRALRPLG